MTTDKLNNSFLLGDMNPKTLKGWMDNLQYHAVGSAILWASYKLGKPVDPHPIVSRILLAVAIIVFISLFFQAIYMVSEFAKFINIKEPTKPIFKTIFKISMLIIIITIQLGIFSIYGSVFIGAARP